MAATPIGNTGDASARLRAGLERADVVAAEDTRRLRALARRLDVRVGGRLLALHEHNERVRTAELLEEARAGRSVLVVSDAGMPSVSDPGYRLVVAAADAGVPVTVAPGPSAVLTALVVSGLASDRFTFEGFLPIKKGRQTRMQEIARSIYTTILYESPHRLVKTLGQLSEHLHPSTPVVVVRELTKLYEEAVRGTILEVLQHFTEHEPRGEFVIVIGRNTTFDLSSEDPSSPDAPPREEPQRMKRSKKWNQ